MHSSATCLLFLQIPGVIILFCMLFISSAVWYSNVGISIDYQLSGYLFTYMFIFYHIKRDAISFLV